MRQFSRFCYKFNVARVNIAVDAINRSLGGDVRNLNLLKLTGGIKKKLIRRPTDRCGSCNRSRIREC